MSAVRARLAVLLPLLERLEGGGSPAHAAGRQLARELLDAHHAALRRALALIDAAPGGAALTQQLCADADVAALLMLHGLHPEPLAARARRAVAALAPRLAAGGARLELTGVDDDGTVRLRLEHAGPRGAQQALIERALAEAAADAPGLRIDEDVVAPLRFAPARGRP